MAIASIAGARPQLRHRPALGPAPAVAARKQPIASSAHPLTAPTLRGDQIAYPPGYPIQNPNALQKHLSYFDTNGDGKVSFGETYAGVRKLGLSPAASFAFAVITNGAFGPRTEGKLSFDVDIKNIRFAKHPADSGVLDASGNLVPAKLDRMFSFDPSHSGKMSMVDFERMMSADGNDVFGRVASFTEFYFLMKLCSDTTKVENGKTVPAISRQRVEDFYSGTLFFKIAAERQAARAARPAPPAAR